MNSFQKSFLLSFLLSTAYADVSRSDLIKINKTTNPKCVTFYHYEGELYCSVLPENNTIKNNNLKNYEKQKIIFDKRLWQAAWGKKTSDITTIEYVPAGDNVENWHELVTSQFLPTLKNASLEDVINQVLHNLQTTGLNPQITPIERKSNYYLFEFKINNPSNMKQDELQKIIKRPEGIYILHYAIKQETMSNENRNKWIKNLRASSLLVKD